MSNLRFRARHVQATVAAYVISGLTDRGWVDPPRNFELGARPENPALTFLTEEPDDPDKKINVNTVSITLGPEGQDQLWELGGGLYRVRYPLFVDIYGSAVGISLSIASDVKGLLRDAVINARDYSADPAGVETSEQIEFEEVAIEKPQAVGTAGGLDFKRYWRIVRAAADVYFTD